MLIVTLVCFPLKHWMHSITCLNLCLAINPLEFIFRTLELYLGSHEFWQERFPFKRITMLEELETTTDYNDSSHNPLLTSTGPKTLFWCFFNLWMYLYFVFVYVSWGMVYISGFVEQAQTFLFSLNRVFMTFYLPYIWKCCLIVIAGLESICFLF